MDPADDLIAERFARSPWWDHKPEAGPDPHEDNDLNIARRRRELAEAMDTYDRTAPRGNTA